MIAIDLGSNTLRVLEYDCTTHTTTYTYEKIVRTADGLAAYNTINKNSILRVISAIKEVKEKIDFSSQQIKAVTTEALRRASNADAVLKEIEKETDVCFKIISGTQEAKLTLLAVKNRLKKLQYISTSCVLVDIGGGSTEIIFHYSNETITQSFPIGIVTIAQSYDNLDTMKNALPNEMLTMRHFVHETYARKGIMDTFVATSGTPTTVAAMKLGLNYETYNPNKINGTTLHQDELDIYLAQLLSLSFKERELAVGIGRSDLIAAGILIYKEIFILLGIQNCIVIDDGLREGLVQQECYNTEMHI